MGLSGERANFPDGTHNWTDLSGKRANFPDGTHNWTDLSGERANFPDGTHNWTGLSGKRANFPDGTHNWTGLSGKAGIFPDNNAIEELVYGTLLLANTPDNCSKQATQHSPRAATFICAGRGLSTLSC